MAVLGNAAISLFVALAAWAFLALPERSDGSSVFQIVHGSKDLLSTCGLLSEDEFTLYSQRVVTPHGVIPAAVHVRGGVIQSVISSPNGPPDGPFPVHDYGRSVIMPGLIDSHVHMNEPGRTDWEGMATGTQAAAAGGFSTVVDMPLNNIPITTTPEALAVKLKAAEGKLSVDVGFWGGLTPENAVNETKLSELLEAGVLGLKAFLCPSGTEFPQTTPQQIESALPVLGRYGLPLLVHSELPMPVPKPSGSPQKYETYLKTKPPEGERAAIAALIAASRSSPAAAKAHIHIVHLADAESLAVINAARATGANLTVETCNHYITFAAEDIPDKHTEYKCAPPIRDCANRDKLWEGLRSGGIDQLASDHSPSPPERKFLKEGDFLRAWGGISSIGLGLPVTWTRAKAVDATLEDVARWWSAAPAKLAGLKRKGSIEAGKDADFVIWDPEAVYTITEDMIYFKHKLTPYTGMEVSGKVEHTFVRGQLVFSKGEFPTTLCGQPILQFPHKKFRAAASA
ncbi:Dihydroorotase and related enzymes [Klebsormidium nitens]|uniref:allantoinase n=1 Tax=Klebsormidium nitens TaxID=105231 RepID=A0A1Y1I9P9_KLENI|nr:Dihydroorotase and related enzymes [Klebsormidium nitens]|eukprot:GAQ84808.1 Dihydroorotase and related enzymes [Klebsormidium nitens]